MVEDFIAPLIADSISHGSTSHNIANTQISIRHARQEDLLEILQIERLSCPSPWTFDIFNHFLETPGFLVATTPSENSSVGDILPISNTHPSPIGFIIADVILEDNLPLGHIKDLAVSPHWRKKGVGTFLLSRILHDFRLREIKKVKLEVREGNTTAISLYKKFGFSFHHSSPGYYADGENALVLVSDLLSN
tara:strand:- start:3265 stop:3840 length:576 start_codon:yes stop_codon:yes gene_type:complete